MKDGTGTVRDGAPTMVSSVDFVTSKSVFNMKITDSENLQALRNKIQNLDGVILVFRYRYRTVLILLNRIAEPDLWFFKIRTHKTRICILDLSHFGNVMIIHKQQFNKNILFNVQSSSRSECV